MGNDLLLRNTVHKNEPSEARQATVLSGIFFLRLSARFDWLVRLGCLPGPHG